MNFYGGNGKDEENAEQQKSLFRAMEFDGTVLSTECPPCRGDRLVLNGIPPVPFQPNLLADGHGKWLFSHYPMDESKKAEWHPEFSAGRGSRLASRRHTGNGRNESNVSQHSELD